MTDAQQVPQVEKKLYKNQTGGWLGVVVIDFSGKDVGVSIEPHGTVWLSDAEAILTARAPKDPKDNPFVEQEFVGIDSNGTRKVFSMAPLALASNDSRYVPSNDRYVPIFDQEGDARNIASARAEEPPAITPAAAARSAEIVADRDLVPPPQAAAPSAPPTEAPGTAPAEPGLPAQAPVPTSPAPVTTGVEPLPSAPEAQEQSWVAEPEAPGQVLPGALGGSDEPAPDPSASPAPPAPAAPPVPAQATPTAPGGNPEAPGPTPDPSFPTVESQTMSYTDPATGQTHEVPIMTPEETAAAVDPAIGEETGAAKPPVGDQPEGEFGQAEEVGSPEAPAQG